MRRAVSWSARAAFAVTIFLLILAVLRWTPVYAEPPWDVRALPLFPPALLLAIVAALFGGECPARSARSLRPVILGLLVVAASLALVVRLRPPAGIPGVVFDPGGEVGRLPPGPVDVTGPDLRHLPAVRKWTFRWDGSLRAPETGTYRLWAAGRGELEVTLDGWPVLRGAGEPLRAGADVPITRGEHRIEVRHQRVGPGPRLKLGWTRPARDGRPHGRQEVIPPRFLGAETSSWLWRLTDALAFVLAALSAALAWLIPWDRARRLPSPAPISAKEVGFSLAGHAALVVLMSWPLVKDLAGSGVMDRPDGRLNAWIMAWDVQALLHQPARLFDAPIFHPLPDALAFSENLLVPAVLAAPAILLDGPVLGYNLVLLLSMILSGLGAQLLVRRASGDRLAAFVGGAVFAVGSHRWIRLAHLHAQVSIFLPFALLALDHFWERRTLRRALLVGLLLALQGLSSVYLGAITALALLSAVVAGAFGGLRGRDLLRLLAALGLAALLLAPVARPYLRMRSFQGVEWSLEYVAAYATTLESYAAGGTRLYGPLTQKHLDPERVQDTLFPGLLPLVLGVTGLASAPRRYRAVALLASAAAVVFSLGPQTGVYRFLHDEVVLVRGVRALSRFSLIPVLALAVLTGFALAGRRWLRLASLALFLAESSNAPIRYAAAAPPSPAARWLAGQEGAVAYLPLGERDTQAMLEGVAHFRPLVNGDSGFVPRPYARAMELLEGPVSPDALRLLRAVGVRHVVAREDGDLPLLARFGEERVYEVPPGEAAREVVRRAAHASLWGPEGIRLDLGQAGPVGSVAFEVGDGDWVSRPRVEVSQDGRRWQDMEAWASLADATLSLMKEPRRGLGEVRFGPAHARFLRLDARLPARAGVLWVGP